MDPQKKKAIFTICGIVVIILAVVLLVFGGKQSDPPTLTVSNEYGIKIRAQRGTYSWRRGSSYVTADSEGPLALYDLGELPHIEASENDDHSLILKFSSIPQSVIAGICPESAAEGGDCGKMIPRDVTGGPSGYKFTVPDDGIYIVDVSATWANGGCHYYFYTTP